MQCILVGSQLCDSEGVGSNFSSFPPLLEDGFMQDLWHNFLVLRHIEGPAGPYGPLAGPYAYPANYFEMSSHLFHSLLALFGEWPTPLVLPFFQDVQ